MPTRTINLPVAGLDDHDSVAIDDIYVSNLRNVRSDRSRIVTAPGGTLLAPPPLPGGLPAGTALATGTFTANKNTGNQTVAHNLGVVPKAIILFMTDKPTSSSPLAITSGYRFSYGMSDGTTSRSVSIASLGNATPTDTARRYASKVITEVNPAGTLHAEADWFSWSAANFVINWTTTSPGSASPTISYVVIGHSAMSAKVREWTLSAAAGSQAVTGVGFLPQMVLHMTANVAAIGTQLGGMFGLGCMSAVDQWAIASFTRDDAGSGPMAGEAHYVSSALVAATTSSLVARAAFVSMDADGFTVTKQTAPSSGILVASLCFSGLANVKAGSFECSAASAPVTQAVTGVGFAPLGGMMHAVYDDGAMDAYNAQRDQDLMVGAFNPVSQSVKDVFQQTAANPVRAGGGITNSDSFASTQGGKNFASGSGVVVSSYSQRGSVLSFDSDGFTMRWTLTAAVAGMTGQRAFYWVLRSSSSSFSDVGVIRNYGDLIVGGTTPVEKIVMLTSKSAFIYTPQTPSTGIFSPTSEVYTGTDIQRFSIANGTDATYGAVAAWSQGKDNIRYYDGSTFGDLITAGTNHAARIVLPFDNRIVSVRPFVAGVDQKTQIRWCVNGDFSDWAGTGSGTLEVVQTSNQALTGGILLGSRCYLTRAREVVELIATGSLSPVFIPEVRVSGVGCIATHSMAAGDIYAFWLGPDEIYQWDGAQLKAVGGRTYNTITELVDYENLDQIQGVVYTPDSQYELVVPPYKLVYDNPRAIWDWDDTRDFQAIGILSVQDLITADLDHSEFVVIGDSSVQTVREDPTINTYLGSPIDAYYETKDFLPLALNGKQFEVSFDKHNTVWRVWFRGTPGELVEVAVSTDKGASYPSGGTQIVTVNAQGVGIFFSDVAWGVLRIRFRSQAGSLFEIMGPHQIEFTEAGVMLPP